VEPDKSSELVHAMQHGQGESMSDKPTDTPRKPLTKAEIERLLRQYVGFAMTGREG
jgi:hypothetical protein